MNSDNYKGPSINQSSPPIKYNDTDNNQNVDEDLK